MCFEFGSSNSHMILRPWPGYVPKLLTTHFQDPMGNLLCPIHTLQIVEVSEASVSSWSALEVSRRERLSSKKRLAH